MLRRTGLSRKVIRAPGKIKLKFYKVLIKPFKNTFQCIFPVRSGKFSPATNINSGVFTVERKTGLEHNYILTTLILNKESILAGVNPGLYRVDLSRNRFSEFQIVDYPSNFPEESQIRKVHRDKIRNIWTASSKGIQRLDITKGTTILNELRNVTEKTIYDLHEDPSVNFYVST